MSDDRAQIRAALARLYRLYVVEYHGAGTCDCDEHLPICAPCMARDALGINLDDERRAADATDAVMQRWKAADQRAAADPSADIPQ